jgi:hypothetical protein
MKELAMSFDPQTIKPLGLLMYSSIPNALAEIIANSYDSGAKEVNIILLDSDNKNKEIIILDDGCGVF